MSPHVVRRSVNPVNRKERRQRKRQTERQDKALARLGGAHEAAIAAAIDKARRLASAADLETIGKGLRLLIDIGQANAEEAGVQLAVGKACCDVHNFDLAYRFLKQSVVLAPDNDRAWRLFATCLLTQKQFEAARIAIETALRLQPRAAGGHLVHGEILSFLNEDMGALEAYDRAIAQAKGKAKDTATLLLALLAKGRHQQALGDIEAARALFFEALDIKPDDVNAVHALSAIGTRFANPDEIAGRLETALRTQPLDDERRAQAYFALGRILADEKRHDEAFPNFVEGNRIRSGKSNYRIDATTSQFSRLVDSLTAERLDAMSDLAHESERPVFIVGMPRSGTTLTEAILARHPKVKACGERIEMPLLADRLASRGERILTGEGAIEEGAGFLKYPQDLERMDRDALRALRDGFYQDWTRGAPQQALRLVDKMPFNFVHIGLIAVLFPKAKIIHCTRDPMDTCLSCYTHNFGDNLDFTYDLETLGLYYRQYRRLMNHWKSVLPDRIFELSYEAVVADQENASRTLIDHIGLEWDKACLEFHQAGFQTKTASNWQVRQRIYTSSVRGWTRYERFLEPLRKALGDLATVAG